VIISGMENSPLLVDARHQFAQDKLLQRIGRLLDGSVKVTPGLTLSSEGVGGKGPVPQTSTLTAEATDASEAATADTKTSHNNNNNNNINKTLATTIAAMPTTMHAPARPSLRASEKEEFALLVKQVTGQHMWGPEVQPPVKDVRRMLPNRMRQALGFVIGGTDGFHAGGWMARGNELIA